MIAGEYAETIRNVDAAVLPVVEAEHDPEEKHDPPDPDLRYRTHGRAAGVEQPHERHRQRHHNSQDHDRISEQDRPQIVQRWFPPGFDGFASIPIQHFAGVAQFRNGPCEISFARPAGIAIPDRLAYPDRPAQDGRMPALEQITIAPHLSFDALTSGVPGAPLVLLLHGFAESMNCWRAQVTALGDMTYRSIAPSQRGYSPGARPDPREFSHYLIDRLMDDAAAIAAAAGYGEARFHLAGHDWGGSIAWGIADRAHERLALLSILSAAHPKAFNCGLP